MHVRSKGHNGEREFAKILEDKFNVEVSRNVDQVRGGGCDISELPPFAIEVKRCETLSINNWQIQAIGQTTRLNKIPVIAYRQNRRKWRVQMLLKDIGKKKLVKGVTGWVDMDLESFLTIAGVLMVK